MSVASRFVMPALAGKGFIFVVEAGSMYPEDHFLFQQRAQKEAGFPFSTELPAATVHEMQTTRLAHFIAAGSQMVTDSFVSRGYARERILRTTYGRDHELFSYKERKTRAGEPVRIGCVGSISTRKGILRLIRINEWAREQSIPCELWLIGPVDPEAAVLLKRTTAPYRALGVHKGRALVELTHQCDLYCLPSYEEGFPLSVLEAMGTGLACIVSDDTAGREAIVEGESGTVLRDFSPAEFEARLRPLLTDASLRAWMGVQARLRMEQNYTLPLYFARVRSEYERMFTMVEQAGGSLPPAWRPAQDAPTEGARP